jgi:hypothetical protein
VESQVSLGGKIAKGEGGRRGAGERERDKGDTSGNEAQK